MKEPCKIGKYDERTLVEIFGTTTQKKKWKEKGGFVSNDKKNFLNRASRYASIKDMGKGQYYVGKIYDYPIPSNFSKMNTSLYQYIIPLVLDRVQQDTTLLNFSFGKWAREIKMVNSNYSLVQYNKKNGAKVLHQTEENIYEYYKRVDEMIDYYFEKAFEYLNATGFIDYQESYMIIKESVDTAELDFNGDVAIDIVMEASRLATQDEIVIYNQCKAVADKEVGIKNDNERYYSSKAGEWHKVLNKELRKYNIAKIYKCHQLYITHNDKCTALRKMFGKTAASTLIKKLTNEFSLKIVENAENRVSKGFIESSEEYIKFFEDMCDILINPKNDKKLYGKLSNSKNTTRKANIHNIVLKEV